MASRKNTVTKAASKKSAPVLSLSVAQNGLHISRDAAALLGDPHCIRFLISRNNRKIALQACDQGSEGAIVLYRKPDADGRSRLKDHAASVDRAPKTAGAATSFRITLPAVMDIFLNLFSVDDEKTLYTMTGSYSAEEKAVIFKTDSAVKSIRVPRGRKKSTSSQAGGRS
ncbi:MAG: hypothetical protein LKJ76_09005 [Lachnospiraceae bacterium]|jgi:hypothetical protein|nr:hypothetical protein [Lachnospiraceae bacterium]